MIRWSSVAAFALAGTACGSPRSPSAPPSEVTIAAPVGDGGGPGPRTDGDAAPRRSVVVFRFPLKELTVAAERDPGQWDLLSIHLVGRLKTGDADYEVRLRLEGPRAVFQSRSKGASASSVRMAIRPSGALLNVLRACARGCRIPEPGRTDEPWHRYDFDVTIEHPRFGSFHESRDVARVLAPSFEGAFAAVPEG